jgi:hypothetical protein
LERPERLRVVAEMAMLGTNSIMPEAGFSFDWHNSEEERNERIEPVFDHSAQPSTDRGSDVVCKML